MDRHLRAASLTLTHADPCQLLALAVLAQAWGAVPQGLSPAGSGPAPRSPAALALGARRPALPAASTRSVLAVP